MRACCRYLFWLANLAAAMTCVVLLNSSIAWAEGSPSVAELQAQVARLEARVAALEARLDRVLKAQHRARLASVSQN